MIIDGHAHVSPTDYGNTDIYLKLLKEAGIDRGVVVPGAMMDVRRMTDYITGAAKPENPIPNNAYVVESCSANQSQLNGFVCVNPHDSDGLEKLESSFRSGSSGLKFSPLTHQFSFGSKSVAALVDLCGEFGFPVYTHVVFSPGASTAKYAELAKQFPKTNFILGHMGFGPADREAVEAAMLDNFYLETSTGSFLNIQQAVNKAGADKVIFGSEFPLAHPANELQKIMLLDVSDDARERILGGNIRDLVHLS
jgi:predicted TIM-barrel fold metal-dependent hydrolase